MSYELKKLTSLKQQESTKTINFDPSMSAFDIQNLIYETELDLHRYKRLILQFADGTYNLDNKIYIGAFRGQGFLEIRGNMSEDYNSAHTNQAVIINFSNNYNFGLVIEANQLCAIYIYNLKITKQSLGINSVRNTCILALKNGGTYIGVFGCYTSLSDNKGHNMQFYNSQGDVRYNYVSGGYAGLYAWSDSMIQSGENYSIGNKPQYGLVTYGGGNISKVPNKAQPTGSVSNEYEGWGTGGIT